MKKTDMQKVLMFRLLGMPILALSCAALAAGQSSNTSAIGQSSPTHPQIAGIRVDKHVPVLSAQTNASAVGYCNMDVLADEHSTIFAPGTFPNQNDYLLFVTAPTSLNMVTDNVKNFSGSTSGIDVLSSPGPVNGQWTIDFAPDYGYYLTANDGSSNPDENHHPLCKEHGQVFRTPILHDVCPTFPVGGTQDATFDLTYVGAGSVVIDPTNLGSRELLAIYNGNNNCVGHNGNPINGHDEMQGYYATTGVATSDQYGRLWPIYKDHFEFYPGETPSPPNKPEGASGADVCRSTLDETCFPATYGSGIYFGRYPAVTPSYTLEAAIAENSATGLNSTMGAQEPSAFVDDVHASLMSNGSDIYLYAVQNSGCSSKYCPLSDPVNDGTISVARARLNGGTGQLKFTMWYGPSADYASYVNGTAKASFDLQTEKDIRYVSGTVTNAGTGHDGGGLSSPIFPMDPTRSPKSYLTCQAGGSGKKDGYDERQSMGSISYVPATGQYLVTFLCSSPSEPAQGEPNSFDDANPQDGAAIFYSTLDADLYDLSRQDKWSPPQEVLSSWEPFTPDRRVCSYDHKLCRTDQDCAGIAGNTCALPSASDCLKYQSQSIDPTDTPGDVGCELLRYAGWYPSFVSTGKNTDSTHPVNPSYLSTTADGYIFSMEGCLGSDCREYPRVYNTRQFWIDVTTASAASIAVAPTSLQFASTVGGAIPATQSIQVTNSGGGTLNWSATTNASWLSVAPASGTAPSRLSVLVSPTGLAAGKYTGSVQISAAGASNSPASVTVALTVAPAAAVLAVSPQALTFNYITGGAAPATQKISIANSGGGTLSWTASANAAWVGLSSASGTAPAAVSVSVNPATLAAGSYSATVLITAAGATGSPASISVSLVVEAPQPTVNITAVANGASYQAGFASATWVSIFGTDLSQTTRTWQNSDFVDGLLPTSLSGVSVTINGQAAYVEYIGPTQVNVLAPDDATVGAVQVQVTTAQGKSNSFTAQKQQFAPGFFTIGGNYVAAQHADYSYVGKPGLLAGATTQPAKPGETILIYGTGFGPTNPPLPSAQLVTTPAVLANSVQVTIGGVLAPHVAYAGLVEAGLYQFNVTVPNVPGGDAAVVARVGGVQTQTGVLITIQQ